MDFEEALASLPEGARQVFVLHDVEGYRHEEIARMLASCRAPQNRSCIMRGWRWRRPLGNDERSLDEPALDISTASSMTPSERRSKLTSQLAVTAMRRSASCARWSRAPKFAGD